MGGCWNKPSERVPYKKFGFEFLWEKGAEKAGKKGIFWNNKDPSLNWRLNLKIYFRGKIISLLKDYILKIQQRWHSYYQRDVDLKLFFPS